MVEQNLSTVQRSRDQIFEEEFLPHLDALYNFAFHLTYDEDDANDLVQDTYLKALRFIDSYVGGSNAKAWLFTIMKNGFINEYRRKARRPNRVDFEEVKSFQNAEETNYNDHFSIREELFDNLIGDEVTNAINTLPVEYRTVILLCDVEDFKYEEIATILDVPIGTVRSRFHRARNMLKEKLQVYAEGLGYEDKRN